MSKLAQHLIENGMKLGGSRRMAQKFPNDVIVSDETDWDLYCAGSDDEINFLVESGFKEHSYQDSEYWDDQLISIWKKDNVEVLIRRDIVIYSRAFESLSAEQYVKYLWKSSPRFKKAGMVFDRQKVCDFFNALFKLVDKSVL